uniref:Saposin B-type domain-containing protein n=1 Tax=Onchocerca volvulus TaxID=6282 RepID=A0A2K6VWL1_ONCVO
MIISMQISMMLLSFLPFTISLITENSIKMCYLCLQGMVGIIHDLNDSKATILAKIDKKCSTLSGMDVELYRLCVTTLSKIYLKITAKMEKQFDPNSFCRKIHICPKFL